MKSIMVPPKPLSKKNGKLGLEKMKGEILDLALAMIEKTL
jgi:hypothetical protein